MKQVQIVEALETEHVDAPSANDVLMVQHLSRDASWADVVDQFHKEPTPKEINEVAVNLAKDKRLVGALDTACNRTCTGTSWLRSYLDHLALAPPHVRKLVEKVEEKEVFRFGNGGTQISHERWKLPAVIDGTLVCFWTSLVPVPSLGLLLGRDFLDALGTVMHFSKRLVRFEKIGKQCIPLRQLTAGHFMLPLPPEDGDWPGATAQNRWRKLGVDGVVELQLSAKSWLDSKLQMSSSKGSQSHEHMLTENSMSVGHAVCAIVNQEPSPVDLDQGVARMKLVAPSRGGSSTTSPTRTSTTSSTTSFEDDENKRTCGSDSSSGKSHRKMEQNGPQAAQKVPMARARSSSVVGAKGLLALCALSIPLGVHMRGLDGAGKQDGFQGRSMSQRHHERAVITNAFTAANLAECIWLRNRVGIKVAFMEDPILDGMLAAKASKGTAQAVRREAYAEAQKQAQILAAQDRLQEAARELLGPKGGLPTLKKDLIKLAAFLEQPVDEKATVDQLKSVLRPLVTDMFKGSPKKSTSSSSSQAVVPQAKVTPTSPQRPPPVAVQSQGLLPTMSQGLGREPYPVAMDLQSVVSTEMEEANWITEMTEREREEAMAAGADYLYEQRLAAQYGQEAIPYLTREEIERVIDP